VNYGDKRLKYFDAQGWCPRMGMEYERWRGAELVDFEKGSRYLCGLSSHFSTRSSSKLLARADKLHVSTAMLQTSTSIAVAARQYGGARCAGRPVSAPLSHKGSRRVGLCVHSDRPNGGQTMIRMFGLVFLQNENPKPFL
jgi:hypothetical protein